jgi:hypothetical protein
MSGMMTLSIHPCSRTDNNLIRLFEFLKNDSRLRSDIPSGAKPDKISDHVFGGGERDRTDDPLLAKQVLSQLSYTPELVVGLVGFEPTTPALSRRCSNRLSYRPPPAERETFTTLPAIFIAGAGLSSTTADKCGHLKTPTVSRKEVIQPHLPIRLPCYDFTPVTNPAVVIAPLAVRLTTSGRTRSHGVTGGVYKTRERIHRGKLIRDY